MLAIFYLVGALLKLRFPLLQQFDGLVFLAVETDQLGVDCGSHNGHQDGLATSVRREKRNLCRLE